jgi:hypothetical protein
VRFEQLSANKRTNDEVDALDNLWDLATVEVINAQLAYAELTSTSDDDEAAVAAAWLRLWRAEERQRRVSALFEA